MFTLLQHKKIRVFHENEGERLIDETGLASKKTEIRSVPKSEILVRQEAFDRKKMAFLDAQKKTITLGNSLEAIANEKIDAVMKTNLYDYLEPEARKKKIQELIAEFMSTYKSEYDALKTKLQAIQPPKSQEDITEELGLHEEAAFDRFINGKRKEIIEKRKDRRRQRQMNALVLTGNEEIDASNRAMIGKFPVDYQTIRKKILLEHPELEKDKNELRKVIRKTIDAEFLLYCQENGIEIDTDLLASEGDVVTNTDIDSDVTEETIQIQSKGSIFDAQDQYVQAAMMLKDESQEYQEERSKYENIEYSEGEIDMAGILPKGIDTLEGNETLSFIGASGSSEVIYEATREPDGEYTLKFGGHTMKNLPKKEMEIIVDLNKIPVINTIFSVQSELYRTLFKEYKFLCLMGGSDPLENPPLGFIDFLYLRLNDAYMATLPENSDGSLIGKSIVDMPYKERGKYIRNLLSANGELRAEVLGKLQTQKILVDGRINLSKYPR